MANVVSTAVALPVFFENGQNLSAVQSVSVSTIDTADTDIIVHSPAADKFVALVGVNWTPAASFTLTLYSGSTAVAQHKFAANTPLPFPVSGNFYFVTQAAGDDLIIRVDIVPITETPEFLFVEGSQFYAGQS